MSMDLGPEERERIISRSAQMMALAREVIRNMHDSPDGPVFGDEPGIPEVVAVAQLIANLNAAGFFRDKASQPPAAPTAFVPTAEVQKVLMVDPVVVLLQFLAWILKVMHFHVKPQLAGDFLYLQRQVRDPVSLLELIENPVLAGLRGVLQGEREALHGVAERQKPPNLVALAEGRQRMVDNRLAAVAIDDGAKRLIEVHSREKARVSFHRIDARSEHYSLHNIG